MARCRVTMKVERAGLLQYPVKLQKPYGHYGEIGHHVVFLQEGSHSSEHFGGVRVAARHHLIKSFLGFICPVPRILEGFNLGR